MTGTPVINKKMKGRAIRRMPTKEIDAREAAPSPVTDLQSFVECCLRL